MENLVKAPVAKPGYSSGLVCIESGKPQVAGSNPARGSIDRFDDAYLSFARSQFFGQNGNKYV